MMPLKQQRNQSEVSLITDVTYQRHKKCTWGLLWKNTGTKKHQRSEGQCREPWASSAPAETGTALFKHCAAHTDTFCLVQCKEGGCAGQELLHKPFLPEQAQCSCGPVHGDQAASMHTTLLSSVTAMRIDNVN